MSIAGVADTHTAIWYILRDPRLSADAKRFIDDAAGRSDNIAVSSITLIEAIYLVEKGRLAHGTYAVLLAALADPDDVFIEVTVNSGIADTLLRVSRAEVPDMPDRIVAATGVYLGVPVISRDRKIRAASLQTIW